MQGNAAADRASDDESPPPSTRPSPPLADLAGRPEPTPGPLTKPAPVVRPPRRRARWLAPLIAVVVLAAAAGAVIVWQATQAGLS